MFCKFVMLIVLKEVSPFFIMIVCKFIDNSTLSELIKKNKTRKIILAEDAINILFEIFNNYHSAIQNKIKLRNLNDKILVVLRIISYANIDKDKFNLTFDILKNLIESDVFEFTDYREINRFVITLHNKNKKIFTEESIINILETFSRGFEKNHWDEVELRDVKQLYNNLCSILNNLFPDVALEDWCSEIVLKKNYVDILPNLFLIVSEDIKTMIKKQIDEEMETKISTLSYIEMQ